MDTIYEVPLLFESFGLGDLVVRELGLTGVAGPADLTAWTALVGKYIELPDAYLSVTEALRHAGWSEERAISIRWIDSERLTTDDVEERLAGVAGVLVPGGFGHRGIEGKVLAARYARERGVPYLGL